MVLYKLGDFDPKYQDAVQIECIASERDAPPSVMQSYQAYLHRRALPSLEEPVRSTLFPFVGGSLPVG